MGIEGVRKWEDMGQTSKVYEAKAGNGKKAGWGGEAGGGGAVISSSPDLLI
jgi:hypothetical protein